METKYSGRYPNLGTLFGQLFKRKDYKMKQEEIIAKARRIIADRLDVEENEVIPTASLYDDLGADSLDAVEIIMDFENTFDISIADDQGYKCKTVQELYDLVLGMVQ